MSIIAPAGVEDSAFDPHGFPVEPEERESDPVADYLRERGLEDPQFLGHVSPGLRLYHDWFRAIVLPAAQQHGGEMIHIVPEFAADMAVRRAAGFNQPLSADELRVIDQLMRASKSDNYPQGEFLPGRPIPSPFDMAREEYMDWNVRLGTCHVCGKEEMLRGRIQLFTGQCRDRIEAIRVEVGGSHLALLQDPFDERCLDVTYTKGVLYPNGSGR